MPAGARGTHDALQRLALSDDARRRLTAYVELLGRWSTRINLTGARTADERVRLLITPAMTASRALLSGHLLDVGSGNGSPGLVLAALHSTVPVTLLEPRVKRWAFLREAARAIGRPEIEVLRQRHEEYAGRAADTLTVRALSLSLSAAARLVRPGGRLIVLGIRPHDDPAFQQLHDDAWCGVHVFERTAHGLGAAVPRET